MVKCELTCAMKRFFYLTHKQQALCKAAHVIRLLSTCAFTGTLLFELKKAAVPPLLL